MDYEYDAAGQKQEATNDFLNIMSQGALMTMYFGHGSKVAWASEGLLKLSYLSKLSNKKTYTILNSFSCTVGRFDEGNSRSLSEAFVLEPNVGAIAAVGAARETYAESNRQFAHNFVSKALLVNGNYLGVAYMQSKNPSSANRIADVVLRKADELCGKLGNPIGIKSYKPFHALGEDFLQNYLGMIGLPMDMYPTFATDQNIVLLTEQAAGDPDIMTKIKKQIQGGHDVIITTGLLKAIPEKIAEVCELRCSDLKAIVNDFGRFGKSKREFLVVH